MRSAKAVVALLVLLAAIGCPAQVVTGKIAGIVRDSSGAVLAQSQIVLTNLQTGLKRQTQSGPYGEYVFPNVAAGEYRIEASHAGFSTAVLDRITVQVLQTVSADLSLQIGAVKEQTTVSATAPLLATQTSDLGRVITEEEIRALPLNGRDYLQLATLTPGVNTFYSSQSLFAGPPKISQMFQGPTFLAGTENVGTSITIGINRENSTSYRVDGSDITNPFAGQSSLLPALDSIQEFKVVTGISPAALKAPASVNVLTRGGTNGYHGSLYEFVRNDIFDAMSYFDLKKPALRMNQFGGSFGGPIQKDKTFFFGSYEGFRGRTPASLFVNVPTREQLGGDFTGSDPIFDPLTGLQFPNNVIPSERISQFAKVYSRYIPEPNFVGTGSQQGLNYVAQTSPIFNNDQFTVRMDHTFSQRDALFGRVTRSTTFNQDSGWAPLYGYTYPYSGVNAALNETHAFTNHLFNQLQASYTRSNIYQQQQGANGENVTGEMGLTNIAGSVDPLQFGLPTVIVTPYAEMGPPLFFTPRGGILNLYEVQDNATYLRNKHTFQFGFDISNNRFDTVNPTAPRGMLLFTGIPSFLGGTGNGLADFLLGRPLLTLADAGDTKLALRWTDFEFYGQDDWRVNDRLTVNFGVRYSYLTAPKDKYNNESYFDLGCQCILQANKGEVHNGIYNTPKTDFAPRIGLAWRPVGNSTVVRAGYGIYFFAPLAMGENLFMRHNPPTYTLNSVFNIPVTVTTDQMFPPPLTEPNPLITVFSLNPNVSTPYYQQWQLTVERQFGKSMAMTVGYVGGKGTHLQMRMNANQATPGTEPLASRRPNPAIGDILMVNNLGSSNYNALQVTFRKQTSHGLTFWGSYEHANAFDYGTNEGATPEHPFDLSKEYGRSLYLVPNRARFTLFYELPFGKGKWLLGNASNPVEKLVGGWGLQTITTFQQGTPLTITAPDNAAVGGWHENRADAVPDCDPLLDRSQRTLQGWFNTSCFGNPADNTLGTSRRGAIFAPGLNNWDVAITKDTLIREGKAIRFQLQMFNAFNHPQFIAPNTDVSSPLFGKIYAALKGRSMQLSLQYHF